MNPNNRIISLVVLFFAFLVKYIIFRQLVYADVALDIAGLVGVYMELASAAALLAACLLLTRSIVPSVLLLLLTDIWLFANVMYYNANSVLLDWDAILFANQLRGFEDSILSYFAWNQATFPLITISTVACLVVYQPVKCKQYIIPWKVLAVSMIASVILFAGSYLCRQLCQKSRLEMSQTYLLKGERRKFYKTHSPLAHFGYIIFEAIKEVFFQVQSAKPLSAKEEELLSRIYTYKDETSSRPKGHLMFVLVESFESWALDAVDMNGIEVTENLNHFIRNHSVLLCRNIVSQQKYGRSGDGQLITQTGMLPLLNGVTSMRYGHNTYPNIAHFYPNSVILDPYRNVWNQRVTTYSYGYKRLRENDIGMSTDSIILCRAREELEQAVEPTCVLAITVNTHAPFQSVPATLLFADTYNQTESDYLQTVHYMDMHLGRFLDWADTASVMRNSTIVITADHNHFPVLEKKGRCPLIIKSPAITSSITVPHAYQMDIFPTVLSAIGQNEYGWRGFGINLLDSTAVRIISVESANELSDKLIRSNYFLQSRID